VIMAFGKTVYVYLDRRKQNDVERKGCEERLEKGCPAKA